MIKITVFALALLAPFVSAQTSSPALEIEAIEAHFTGAGLVPSLLPSFTPSAVFGLSFNGVNVSPGQALTKAQVAPTPSLTVTPANSSVTLTGTYTLVMVDAAAVGTDESAGETRHYLLNGATISDSKVSNASAVAITEYAGPAPPANTGPHRYVILLYNQPSTFTAPANYSQPNMGVSVFNLNAYVSESGLGAIVAGTYFTVEEGTATASLSATSAVQTSTLAPVSSASGTHSSTAPGASGSSGSSNGASSIGITSPLAVTMLALVTLAFI